MGNVLTAELYATEQALQSGYEQQTPEFDDVWQRAYDKKMAELLSIKGPVTYTEQEVKRIVIAAWKASDAIGVSDATAEREAAEWFNENKKV